MNKLSPQETLSNKQPTLSPVKRALLKQRLIKKQESAATGQPAIPRRVNQETVPLSFAQQRLWFLQQLEPDSPFYNVTKAIRLSGTLNVDVLQQALDAIVVRHEVLRTTFVSVDGKPKSLITESQTVELPVIAVEEGKTRSQQAAQVQHLINEASQRLFNLSSDLMLRTTLLQLEPTEHILLLVIHHIASDGWSTGILFQELSILYEAFLNGKPSPLSPLPIQYADFAHWQRQWLTGDILEQQLIYWKQQLADAPVLLELPTDHPRPPVQRFQGAHIPISLSLELTTQLKHLSQHAGTTLFMTLWSAFATLLSRYSGQTDIVIGSPIANRTHRQTEPLIGFFVNTLVLRLDLSGNPTFDAVLQQARRIALEAYSYQDIPFEKLVEELKPARNLSHSPLFQVMMVLQNVPKPDWELAGLNFTTLEFESVIAKFDLTLELTETSSGLRGRLEYNTDLFERATIERLSGHLLTLLIGIVDNPQMPLHELPLLTVAEQQQLLAWNETATDYPQDRCIHQLFEDQAEKTPDAVAVVFENQQLTYSELNRQANQLAHHLTALGVKPEVLVGICVERSLIMMSGLLGILKAGGAYLPLDPTYPKARLAFMLENSQISVLLTQSQLIDGLPETPAKIICLDMEIPARSLLSVANPLGEVNPTNLAYVIYTSGSTGKPKGVQICHSSLLNLLVSMHQQLELTSNDVLLAIATLSFDIAALELYLPLITGAKIVLVSREVAADGFQLLDQLKLGNVTILQATPATWQLLLAASWDNSPQLKILCGGEACPSTLATQLLEKGQTLWNLYGPTETTIYSTMTQVSAITMSASVNTIAIGYPIANTQVYLLDSNLQRVPIGVPGELHIGGAGLARGYWNSPDLTAEKFIKNPFSNDPHSRLYKTGDLARYLPDGNIEFLGRIDNQVKIRGFRIELGEIEAVLASHPTIQEDVVVVQESEAGEKRLVAYLVPQLGQLIEPSELRAFLQEKLPDYMIPLAFVSLDHLPLTPNNKVDRRALSQFAIASYQLPKKTFVAPRTEEEELLAGIWSQVLEVERVGVHDNFFELGGHSLLATQMMSRIRETFKIELPLRQLFESPTIAGLSHKLDATSYQTLLPSITSVDRSKMLPLSFAQQRLWFLNQLEGASATYNISSARRLEGFLNQTALEKSLQTVVQRHETLRTTFKTVEGQPVLVISPVEHGSLPLFDLHILSVEEREHEVQRLVNEEAQRPFDLEQGPLFRAILLHLGIESHILILTMHHIISDGWSIGVLLRELSTLYQAFSQGQPSPLSPLPVQYVDFAHWQRQWLTGDILEQQLIYWKQQLADAPVLLELPTDHPRPPVQRFQGAHIPISLSPELTTQLKHLSQHAGTTLFMTLWSAWATLLSRYSGQTDIVIGSPIANRTHRQTEPLIGFFVNTLVLRLDLSGNPTFDAVLQQARRVALEAYSHQDIPFEKLVEKLNPTRNLSHSPLFQVLFVLQNAPRTELEFTGLHLTTLEWQSVIAKFDLTLSLNETTSSGLLGWLEYNTDLFECTTIERLLGHWQTLLTGIVDNPQTPLHKLPLLTVAEQQQLLAWNETATDYPQDRCIHQLFEAQAEKTPDAVAVVFENQQLTYSELNRQANQLAHHLIALGVKPAALIAICIERSVSMVIGLLGILKAGGAYLSMDPTYPKARLAFMLEDTPVPILLTQSHLAKQLPETRVTIVYLDVETAARLPYPITNPSHQVKSTNLAYVIYTSGSTGQPKGVAIPHQAINRLIFNSQYIHLETSDRVAQASNISFDAATFEIWGALLQGAQLIGITKDILLSPPNLAAYLREHKISVIFLTTALFNQLAREQPTIFQGMRQVLFGGEAVEPKWVAKILNHGPPQRLLHVYGPTENTTFTTWYLVTEVPAGVTNIPIGRPIANTQVYVLDQNHQPVPIGVPGELYIGGAGLAQGYLNRPQLTTEKFISNPFSSHSRLYKTGDLVRYLPDGNIEFLGRIDNQVKIRGFRIELGEIEVVLASYPTIQEDVVIVQESESGEKRLVAYLVLQPGQLIEPSELRAFLQEKLPDYMIPVAFVSLEHLPLTPNGKIDRRALSQLSVNLEVSAKPFVAPRTQTEKRLAEIWAEVLGVKRVGIYDNFFDLGGHSLLAVILLSKIEKKLGQNLPLATLFQAPTVEQLAHILYQTRDSTSYLSLVPLQPHGSKPPLFCIPPAGNTVTGFIDLVRHLGSDQPVYGLQPLGLDGKQAPHNRVEEMADYYLKEVRTFQPDGPYYLAGLCFGSHIAWEMAQQLQVQGDSIALLALLDPGAPIVSKLPQWAEFENLNSLSYYIYRTIYHYRRGQWYQLYSALKDFMNRRYRWFKMKLNPQHRRRLENVMAAHQMANMNYRIPVYSGKVILFRSSEFEALENQGEGPWAKRWSEFTTGGLVRHVIPGGHREILQEPQVRILAERLKRCLDDAQVK
ncbi:MAG: amino acid adenylation domain-containing protein [Thioploca sp.]|nr:amino acid adenylation domain-containing protein [Thioploca sp.]